MQVLFKTLCTFYGRNSQLFSHVFSRKCSAQRILFFHGHFSRFFHSPCSLKFIFGNSGAICYYEKNYLRQGFCLRNFWSPLTLKNLEKCPWKNKSLRENFLRITYVKKKPTVREKNQTFLPWKLKSVREKSPSFFSILRVIVKKPKVSIAFWIFLTFETSSLFRIRYKDIQVIFVGAPSTVGGGWQK